jgi:hypothetical protein
MLSERVRAWVRRKLEKAADVFYEGEAAPERLREQVIAFSNLFPSATRGDWIAFAAGFAEECYRAGYLRGVEYVERDPEAFDAKSPEAIADEIDPNWRWRPMIEVENDLNEIVGDERPEHEAIQRQYETITRKARRF